MQKRSDTNEHHPIRCWQSSSRVVSLGARANDPRDATVPGQPTPVSAGCRAGWEPAPPTAGTNMKMRRAKRQQATFPPPSPRVGEGGGWGWVRENTYGWSATIKLASPNGCSISLMRSVLALAASCRRTTATPRCLVPGSTLMTAGRESSFASG